MNKLEHFLKTPGACVHFIGCEGAGMKPLRKIFDELGFRTSGSDLTLQGHDASFLPQGVSGSDLLVIYSSAVPAENPEMVRAKERNASFLLRGHALGEIAKLFPCVIAVSGSHGKTSVSSAIAHILKENGLNPGYLIGGKVCSWTDSGSAGGGKIFVCEADESDSTHTALHSTLAVVTNMEDDHVWNFSSPEELENNFRTFAFQGGKLLAPAIDCLKDHPAHTLTDPEKYQEYFQKFPYYTRINLSTAVQAVTLCGLLPEEKALSAAQTFPGVARRMEFHGEGCSFLLYEDYAHHPTEVEYSLRSFREMYPGKKLHVIFQPHRYARLERYFEEFVQVLSRADQVYVTDVFAAWTSGGKKDSDALVSAIGKTAHRLRGSWAEMAHTVRENLSYGDLVCVLGAGDVKEILTPLQEELFTYSDVGLILPAGGSSSRFGSSGNKLLEDLGSAPVFIRTLQALIPCIRGEKRIVLSVPAGERKIFEDLVEQYFPEDPRILLVNGGSTRTQSVENALKALPEQVRFVAVHDAARPFVTKEDLYDCVEACSLYGGAVSARPQTDTLKRADGKDLIVETVPRESLWSVQTPQVFERELLLDVYRKSASSGKTFTDDAALVEAFSPVRAKLVKGHAHNMKITYAEDLTTARLLWKDNLQ